MNGNPLVEYADHHNGRPRHVIEEYEERARCKRSGSSPASRAPVASSTTLREKQERVRELQTELAREAASRRNTVVRRQEFAEMLAKEGKGIEANHQAGQAWMVGRDRYLGILARQMVRRLSTPQGRFREESEQE